MSDRELLELAAKAAGYWSDEFKCVDKLPFASWDPLTNDGDALRLAVRLRLWVRDGEAQDSHDIYAAEDGDDRYAATRRAIVRAAAEIGRQATTGDTHD